jgi:hypothetical protein
VNADISDWVNVTWAWPELDRVKLRQTRHREDRALQYFVLFKLIEKNGKSESKVGSIFCDLP